MPLWKNSVSRCPMKTQVPPNNKAIQYHAKGFSYLIFVSGSNNYFQLLIMCQKYRNIDLVIKRGFISTSIPSNDTGIKNLNYSLICKLAPEIGQEPLSCGL